MPKYIIVSSTLNCVPGFITSDPIIKGNKISFIKEGEEFLYEIVDIFNRGGNLRLRNSNLSIILKLIN